jgi:hypothetical protein
MRCPGNFRAGFGASPKRIFSRSTAASKAKVGDGFDLRGSWLHGCVAGGDWRRCWQSAILFARSENNELEMPARTPDVFIS